MPYRIETRSNTCRKFYKTLGIYIYIYIYIYMNIRKILYPRYPHPGVANNFCPRQKILKMWKCQGWTVEEKICDVSITSTKISQRNSKSSAAGAFLKNKYMKVMSLIRKYVFMKTIWKKKTKGPTTVKNNELYSHNPKNEIVRNVFHALLFFFSCSGIV